MSRYEPPEPKCRHRKHAVRVTAGNPKRTAYASRWVCDRQVCIDDAKEWAWACTHQYVEVVRRGEYSAAEREALT